MKRLSVVIAAAFLVSMFAGQAFAADKFGYVDLSKIFSEYGKTKDYDKALGEKQTQYNTEREKRVGEIKQIQDKISLLSDKEKEAKKPDIENKIKNLQDYDRQQQTDLRKEQDEKMQEILKDIETAVKQVAEKEGYTMVFNDRVLVYQNKSMEVTDKVISILNMAKGAKK